MMHFVAALEIEPEDHDLVRLGRVARDRHLLGVAAEHRRARSRRTTLDARLEHVPHVIHRELVREAEIADHRLEHVRRRRTQPPLFRLTIVRSTSNAR